MAALRLLGVPDPELSRLREITTFGRTSVSCVTVGQGPAVAGYDRAIAASTVSDHSGFWSGAAVQKGFIVNRCASVTVNATVTVSFGIRRVTHVFIFAQIDNESKSQAFTFRNLRPGEARPFSAGVIECDEPWVHARRHSRRRGDLLGGVKRHGQPEGAVAKAMTGVLAWSPRGAEI